MEFLDITKYAESQDFSEDHQHAILCSKAALSIMNIARKDATDPHSHTDMFKKEQPIGNKLITSSARPEAVEANKDDQTEDEPTQVSLNTDLLLGDNLFLAIMK